jgi:hypothetical protein
MTGTRKPQTRDTYHERGQTYLSARALYLKYPLMPSATIAEILQVLTPTGTLSRQAIDEYTRDLKDERARLRVIEIDRLRGKYGRGAGL